MIGHDKPIIIDANQASMADEFIASRYTVGKAVLDVDGDLQFCVLAGPDQYRWINLENGNRWDDDTDSAIMGYAVNIRISHEDVR